jgi:protein TonB
MPEGRQSPTHGGRVREPRHVTLRPSGEGADLRALFKDPDDRLGGAMGVSVVTHAAFVAIVIGLASLLPQQVYEAFLPEQLTELVWLPQPGPGGGGGGGGDPKPQPIRKAELRGEEKITVPAVPEPEPTPEPPKEEPEPEINLPAQTLAAALTVAPGTIDPKASSVGGAGTGPGTGAGSGQGSGLGPGRGGGVGGGVYQPGNGVLPPVPIEQVKPQYTAEAMRAKVQGEVWVECVVMPDGTVGRVEVIRSLDVTFGLDQEAVKAARQWRFRPGTRFGEPVAVVITIALSFTLR